MTSINQILDNLIASHRELDEFADPLLTEDLTTELLRAACCVDQNLPIVPPARFRAAVEASLTTDEWSTLLEMLKDAGDMTVGDGDESALDGSELETVALGILWSNLLLRDYDRRCSQAVEPPQTSQPSVGQLIPFQKASAKA